jgi:hypothetical protein
MICKKTGETLMKKLIVITAFVLLGILANSAMAAKDKDLRIVSPALQGVAHECLALNASNGELPIIVTAFDSEGVFVFGPGVTVPPGVVRGIIANEGTERSIYCVFEWVGKRSDLILSICSTSVANGRACLNV